MQAESKSVTLRGWHAVLGVTGVLLSWAGTAMLMSVPIVWIINHVFASAAIRALFGGDRFRYGQCVMLFALWYCARVKFTFPNIVKGKF